MLGPWKDMLEKGMTTFGEKDIAPRSECHGWSASPCFDLIHLVAGIYPGSPGFSTVVVAPNFGNLTRMNASFPHPGGMISLELEKGKQALPEGFIDLPAGITGAFIWQGQRITLKPGRNKIRN
jgi:hypothetical protein